MAKYNQKLDLDKIDKLCHIQCTGEEIAGILDMDYDTLNRKLKQETGLKFTEYFKKKSAGRKASLRRRQFAMSETSPTMAIWVGKQYLGQRDKQEIEQTNTNIDLKLDKEARNARIAELEQKRKGI